MVSFEYQGRTYCNVTPEMAIKMGVPSSVVEAAIIDEAWRLVRTKRDRMIAESDYAVMPDYPITDAQKAEVTAYRQTLRDIPATFDSPDAVEWPTKPEFLTR